MRSTWIEHRGKKIFYQDFSKNFYNATAVKAELSEVQKVVSAQPKDSVLVLSDFRDTSVGSDLLTAMNAASAATKSYVHKTAVLGVTGMKRKLGIIQAFQANPSLLILDEPTEGLAPVLIEQMMAAIANLSQETTVVLVEQNFSVASALAQYYVIIEEGRSVRNGLISDLLDDKTAIHRYLGAA